MSIFAKNTGTTSLFSNSSFSSLFTSNKVAQKIIPFEYPSICNNNQALQNEFQLNMQQNGTFDLNFKHVLVKHEDNSKLTTVYDEEILQSMTALKEMLYSFEEYRLKDYQIKRKGRQYNLNYIKYKVPNDIPITNSFDNNWNNTLSLFNNKPNAINNNSLFSTNTLPNSNIFNSLFTKEVLPAKPNSTNYSSPNNKIASSDVSTYSSSNWLSPSNNNASKGLFPTTNNTSNRLFPSNNTSGGLFPSSNNTSSGLFPNNNNSLGNLFSTTNNASNEVFPTNNTLTGVFPTNNTLTGVFPTNNTSTGVFPTNNNAMNGLFPANNNNGSNRLFPTNKIQPDTPSLFLSLNTNSNPNVFPLNSTPTNNNTLNTLGLILNNNYNYTGYSFNPSLNKQIKTSESELPSNINPNNIKQPNLNIINENNQSNCLNASFMPTSLLHSISSFILPSKSTNSQNIFPLPSTNPTDNCVTNQKNTNIPFWQEASLSPKNISFKENKCDQNGYSEQKHIDQIIDQDKIIKDFINELNEKEGRESNRIYYENLDTDRPKQEFIGSYIPKYKAPKIESRKKNYQIKITKKCCNYDENNNNRSNFIPQLVTSKTKKFIDDEIELNENIIKIEERFITDFKIRKGKPNKEKEMIFKPKTNNHSSESEQKIECLTLKEGVIIRSIPIVFKVEKEEYTLEFEVNMNNEVRKLKEAFIDKFNKFFMNQIKIKSILFMIPNQILTNEKKLCKYNLIDSTVIEANITYEFISQEAEINFNKLNTRKDKDHLAPKELIPILTRKDFKVSPDYLSLCRMTTDELKQVQNFKVYNDYGEIDFLERINLLGVNLDTAIDIKRFYVSIYNNSPIPPKRNELNVKRLFTIKQITLTESELLNIKKYILGSNGQFVSYDASNNELKFLQQ